MRKKYCTPICREIKIISNKFITSSDNVEGQITDESDIIFEYEDDSLSFMNDSVPQITR